LRCFVLFIFLSAAIFPQKMVEKFSDDQPGGIYLPAAGKINVLFIFAQFPDDNYKPESEIWKKNEAPERMIKNNWVDAEWAGKPTPFSLTDYFNDMSFGKLQFTGKSIFVIAPHSRDWYIENKKRLDAVHTDILLEADKRIDFAEFDNWKRINSYTHQNRPDSIVDMIFFVWRNIHLDRSKETLDKLGFGWFGSSGVSNVSVDNGIRNVVPLSGVTIHDVYTKDAFRFSIHEFAHYLLGGNEYHNGYAFWAMVNGYGSRSFMINSFERHRLGWSDILTIPTGSSPQEIKLRDFITTGEAVRIEINKQDNLYFYLENHQRISKWDEPSADNSEKGVYVLRRNHFVGDNVFMQLMPADGKYKWEVVGFEYPEYFKKGLPVFKRLVPDRTGGYFDTEAIPFVYEGKKYQPYEVIFYEDTLNGKPVEFAAYHGDGRDAFRPDYKNVFSPWSNPPSYTFRNIPTAIGFYLKNIDNSIADILVYGDSSIAGPPSKPDRPVLSYYGNNIEISWIKNEEPDAAGYRIYIIDGKEKLIGKTDKNVTFFHYGNKSRNDKNIKIKVSCIDKNGEESIKSEIGEWIH